MRVFIAIHFPKEVQMVLYQRVQDLKKASIRGRFTRNENMHLTLAFLGEIASERVEEVIKIMNQVASEHTSFEMKLGGLGKFASRGEGLYWCGIEENEALKVLQHKLVRCLKESEFSVDDNPFKPHITLARRCILAVDIEEKMFSEEKPPTSMKVVKINLMKSEHIEGKLTYSSLGEVSLQE